MNYCKVVEMKRAISYHTLSLDLVFISQGMFDKVLDIDRCHLGSELSDSIRLFVRDYCLSNPEKYPYFDLRNQEGLMRTLMIRTTSIGESMVVVVFLS